jgi:hypothetical protein
VTVAAGLLLALASAVALNWGWVEQHHAAAALPPLSVRRPVASLALLFRNRPWLIGFLTGIGGWALYVGALALAPLSLVQAIAAGGIGAIAFFARAHGARLTRLQLWAVALSLLALLLLGLSLGGGAASASRAPSVRPLALWLAVSAAAAVAAPGARLVGGAGLGTAAGILYAAGDVATKGAVHGGGWLILVPIVLVAHGLAFASLQLAFQRGTALASAGISTLLTNALPITAGVLLFRERLPAGMLGGVRVFAFALVVVAAALIGEPGARPA